MLLCSASGTHANNLIQISLSPEIRLSSDNASFRFPHLLSTTYLIGYVYLFYLSRTFVSVRRSLVRSLRVGIFISILIEVGYSRFPPLSTISKGPKHRTKSVFDRLFLIGEMKTRPFFGITIDTHKTRLSGVPPSTIYKTPAI